MAHAVIYGQDERLLRWACGVIGIAAFRQDARAIGLERDGALIAVVAFDNFSDCDCHMHVASDGTGHWMTRGFLRCAFAFPFIQCKMRRVTGMVPESNKSALAFDEHLGFVREGYHPDAADDGAMVSLGLTKARCKFIPPEHRI